MNINLCLTRTSMTELRAIASYNGISVSSGISIETLKSTLRLKLTDPAWISDKYGKLSSDEKEVLLHIHVSGGDVTSDRIQRLWGGDDIDTSKRWLWEGKVASGLPHLRLLGFLFLIYNTADGKNHYIIPDHLRRYIIPEKPSIPHDTSAPFEYKYHAAAMLQDVFQFIRFIEKHPIRLLKSKRIPKRYIEKIGKELNDRNRQIDEKHLESYLEFIYHCCRKASLIMIRDFKLVPSIRFRKWISMDAGKQIFQLYQAWYNSESYDELKFIPELEIISAGLRNDPMKARQLIIHALKQFPTDVWLSFEDFSQYMRKAFLHFFRPFIDAKHWRVIVHNKTEIPDDMSSWGKIEFQLIKFIISGPLYWFGLTSIGMDRTKKDVSFLLHDFGSKTIRGIVVENTSLMQPDMNRIIIQPDFELIIPENVVLSTKYMVEKFSHLVSTGQVSRYRITKQSIVYALERGMSTDQIIEFLKEVSLKPPPDNVIISIRDWGKQYGLITLQDTVILEAKDSFLIQELLSHKAINKYLGRQLGERCIQIERKHIELLVKELKRAGYLPRINKSLILRWELAPIALQLTRGKADLLLRYLKETLRDSFSGGRMVQHADLISIIDQLQQSIQNLN